MERKLSRITTAVMFSLFPLTSYATDPVSVIGKKGKEGATAVGVGVVLLAMGFYALLFAGGIFGGMNLGEMMAQRQNKMDKVGFYKMGGAVAGFFGVLFSYWVIDALLADSRFAALSPYSLFGSIISLGISTLFGS